MTVPPKSIHSPLQSFRNELDGWYYDNWCHDLRDLTMDLYIEMFNACYNIRTRP